MLILKFTRVAKPVFTFRGKTGKVIEMVQRGGSSAVATVVGPAGGSANISGDLNNGLTTGSDGGLFATNALDLGTFN